MKKKLLHIIGVKFLSIFLNIYIKTLRVRIINEPNYNKHYIFIFWHSKMLVGWWILRNRKICSLVSQSKDGDILTNILRKWNYKVIRGSSSKGAKEALIDSAKYLKENYSLVITPDGPRGPRCQIKNGVLKLSLEGNIKIIPIQINYSQKYILKKSWDKFEIPYPFSKCNVIFGEEIIYNKFLYNEELEKFKNKLSRQM